MTVTINPGTAEHPHRIDFFGDEVDSIRAFSVADQRSLPGEVAQVTLGPSRELLLTASVRQRAAEMQHEFPSLEGMLAKIAEGIPVEGMESLTPALVDKLVPLTEFLPTDAAVAIVSPERVANRAVHLSETNSEFLEAAWNAATLGAAAPIDLSSGDYLTVTDLRNAHPGGSWWTLSAFDADDDDAVRIDSAAIPSFAGNAEGAIGHIASRVADGWHVVVAAEGHGLVERAAQVLGEHEIGARVVESLPETLETGTVYVVQASVEHGFELPEAQIALLEAQAAEPGANLGHR